MRQNNVVFVFVRGEKFRQNILILDLLLSLLNNIRDAKRLHICNQSMMRQTLALVAYFKNHSISTLKPRYNKPLYSESYDKVNKTQLPF